MISVVPVPENDHQGYEELEGLHVKVDDVIYMPTLDAPEDKPHPFVYFISIFNESTENVRITGRKWIVVEEGGETTVVEGDGVVGQSPELGPGGDFSYNSYHVVAKNAVARGSFFGVTETEKKVRVTIPEFRLIPPDWA